MSLQPFTHLSHVWLTPLDVEPDFLDATEAEVQKDFIEDLARAATVSPSDKSKPGLAVTIIDEETYKHTKEKRVARVTLSWTLLKFLDKISLASLNNIKRFGSDRLHLTL